MKALVAGIGNLFLGDDGFGCEVVRRLVLGGVPDGVVVRDFGIRGMDLTYTLLEKWDAVILVDACSRGGAPGTLYVLEPDGRAPHPPAPAASPVLDMHSMEPSRVLAAVAAHGGTMGWMRVVGCEPATFGTEEEPVMGLSPVVEDAVEEAVRLVRGLLAEKSEDARA